MTPEELQHIVYTAFAYHGPYELTWLCNILEKFRLRNVLEIGTAQGASLMVWAHLLEPGGLIVGVDIGGWMCNGIEKTIERRGKNIEFILGDSTDPETIKKVKDRFTERVVDFLFIDGNHQYEYAKQDYLNYGPMVKLRGIIAFHDICHVEVGISRFWKELKKKGDLRTEEYGKSNGIGVIYVEK